jgi:hypothetical protein
VTNETSDAEKGNYGREKMKEIKKILDMDPLKKGRERLTVTLLRLPVC